MATLLHRNFIAGNLDEGHAGSRIPVLNPARDTVISEIPDSPAEAVDRAVEAARQAQKAWAKLPPIQRAAHLRKIAAGIRADAGRIARAIVEEQGKIPSLAEVEVAFTADYLDYTAEWARRIEGEIIASDRPGENIFLFRQPIGVVGGILPWNFPFFLIARKAAPALITGNTIVIKPSEETPNNAAMFAEIVRAAGVPAGVINFVYGRGATTGKALAGHPGVGMISFTGSVETGRAVMAAAAQNITKVNLELGGKAPAIVVADADVRLAVNAIRASRIINSGQVCNCAERVYVERRVADEFVSGLAEAMGKTTYGDPLAGPAVEMGPLINRAGLDKVRSLVDGAVAAGAEVVTGGKVADRGAGSYFEPTVLVNCRQDMDVMREEVFGPVLPVNVVDSLDEAIERANDSPFGLGSSIWTHDLDSASWAAERIQAGYTWVNSPQRVFDELPFGGWGASGFGKEHGIEALDHYQESKSVVVRRNRP
jgi:lactaldehyde dehydrogenase / glycolaldehyde dehydrogenase